MLLQIREYISREGLVSLQQLAREFQVAEQALQPMLAVWIKKGIIRAHEQKGTCQGGCFRCNIDALMFYQYVA